jgi:hypothetical protein
MRKRILRGGLRRLASSYLSNDDLFFNPFFAHDLRRTGPRLRLLCRSLLWWSRGKVWPGSRLSRGRRLFSLSRKLCFRFRIDEFDAVVIGGLEPFMERFGRSRRALVECYYSLVCWLDAVSRYRHDRGKKLFLIFREDLDHISIGLTVGEPKNVRTGRQNHPWDFDWFIKCQNGLLCPTRLLSQQVPTKRHRPRAESRAWTSIAACLNLFSAIRRVRNLMLLVLKSASSGKIVGDLTVSPAEG